MAGEQALTTGNQVLKTLRTKGIINFDCPFDAATLARWNKLVDPLFEKEGDKLRSFILIEDLINAGIFKEFWNDQMRSFVRSLMPDAVIETFEISEVSTHQKEADNYGINNEWHRDIQDLPGLSLDEPYYVAIFIYLTDVGPESGGFEIRPIPPSIPPHDGDPVINVQGPKGTTFIWNRGYYHRASMNPSGVRRRIIKVSLQHNYLDSVIVSGDLYKALREKVSGDGFLEFLLGSKHISTHTGYLLPEVTGQGLEIKDSLSSNKKLHGGIWQFYRRVRFLLKRILKK